MRECLPSLRGPRVDPRQGAHTGSVQDKTGVFPAWKSWSSPPPPLRSFFFPNEASPEFGPLCLCPWVGCPGLPVHFGLCTWPALPVTNAIRRLPTGPETQVSSTAPVSLSALAQAAALSLKPFPRPVALGTLLPAPGGSRRSLLGLRRAPGRAGAPRCTRSGGSMRRSRAGLGGRVQPAGLLTPAALPLPYHSVRCQ